VPEKLKVLTKSDINLTDKKSQIKSDLMLYYNSIYIHPWRGGVIHQRSAELVYI